MRISLITGSASRSSYRLHIVLVLYVLTYGGVLLLGAESLRRIASDILAPCSAYLAAYLLIRAVRETRTRKDRFAWSMFTLSVVWYGIYDTLWRLNDAAAWHYGSPWFEVNGGLFFGVPIFILSAVLITLYRDNWIHFAENVLDILIVAIVMVYFYWHFLLSPQLGQELTDQQAVALFIFTLTECVSCIGLIFTLISHRRDVAFNRPLWYLAAATVVGFLSNQYFLIDSLYGHYRSGDVVDVAFTVILFLIALAGASARQNELMGSLHTRPSAVRLPQTVVTSLFTLGLLAFSWIHMHDQHSSLQYAAVQTAFLLLIVRQFLSILENTLLVRKMERINDRLTRLHEEAEWKAKTDFLTGLYNRRYMMTLLEEWKDRTGSLPDDMPFSLLLLDVDHFKSINDTYGHDCGDYVLKAISSRLQSLLPDVATVGRYGGEEFMIALPQASLPEALLSGEAIRRTIEEEVLLYHEQHLRITASLGAASFHSNESLDALIKRLDENLYKAKREGRNRVVGG